MIVFKQRLENTDSGRQLNSSLILKELNSEKTNLGKVFSKKKNRFQSNQLQKSSPKQEKVIRCTFNSDSSLKCVS